MPHVVRLLLAAFFVCTNATITFAQQPEFDGPSIGAWNTNRGISQQLADAMRIEQEARNARELWARQPRIRPGYERERVFEAPEVTVTPEPVTLALLATGLLGLGAASRRRRTERE